MQIITQSFFSSHCSTPEKMELQEPESNTSSRPPGIHQKLRGYYQEGVRWCLLKRKWKKTSVLVVNPTTHYSTIILLLLLIPLHNVSFSSPEHSRVLSRTARQTPLATAGLARSAGFGRFVDHKPQRSHLKGLSHSIPSMVSLDSVAQTNID